MRTDTTTTQSRAGFTLIELLVVVAVIVVIAGVLLAGLARTVGTARASTAARTVDALVLGVNQFKADFGFLPPLVHDGEAMAVGGYEPVTDGLPAIGGTWPAIRRDFSGITIDQLAVWSSDDGGDANDHLAYANFIRRRAGGATDAVRLPSGGGPWNANGAWDDRRYSKFSLPYYLAGVAGQAIDGVEGQGMSRPLANGLFEGVLYRASPAAFGSTRDRTEPFVDAGRRSLRLVTGYLNRDDLGEHGADEPGTDIPDSHAAFVDPWGRAYRYYRWEPGRLEFGRLVVGTTLDLNIPPVLINPEVYAAVANSDTAARDTDLTSGSAELRAARFAIVSAGEDGLFGTEPIELLAERLREPEPTTDTEIARLRQRAREDNLVGLGN